MRTCPSPVNRALGCPPARFCRIGTVSSTRTDSSPHRPCRRASSTRRRSATSRRTRRSRSTRRPWTSPSTGWASISLARPAYRRCCWGRSRGRRKAPTPGSPSPICRRTIRSGPPSWSCRSGRVSTGQPTPATRRPRSCLALAGTGSSSLSRTAGRSSSWASPMPSAPSPAPGVPTPCTARTSSSGRRSSTSRSRATPRPARSRAPMSRARDWWRSCAHSSRVSRAAPCRRRCPRSDRRPYRRDSRLGSA